jgi:hypothetical protein
LWFWTQALPSTRCSEPRSLTDSTQNRPSRFFLDAHLSNMVRNHLYNYSANDSRVPFSFYNHPSSPSAFHGN